MEELFVGRGRKPGTPKARQLVRGQGLLPSGGHAGGGRGRTGKKTHHQQAGSPGEGKDGARQGHPQVKDHLGHQEVGSQHVLPPRGAHHTAATLGLGCRCIGRLQKPPTLLGGRDRHQGRLPEHTGGQGQVCLDSRKTKAQTTRRAAGL